MVKISKVALKQATINIKNMSDTEVINFLRGYWKSCNIVNSEQNIYLKKYKPRFMAIKIMAMVLTEFELTMNKQ